MKKLFIWEKSKHFHVMCATKLTRLKMVFDSTINVIILIIRSHIHVMCATKLTLVELVFGITINVIIMIIRSHIHARFVTSRIPSDTVCYVMNG